jgi:hypothetical protein
MLCTVQISGIKRLIKSVACLRKPARLAELDTRARSQKKWNCRDNGGFHVQFHGFAPQILQTLPNQTSEHRFTETIRYTHPNYGLNVSATKLFQIIFRKIQ